MTVERRAFPARTEALPRVAAFVEQRCRELGASRDATLRLMLMAEELFINAVTHGYGGAGRGRVTLTVAERGAEVELVAEDAAAAFDVFADVPRPRAIEDPREAPIGGLGRALVAGLAVRQAYERRGSRNRVTVAVAKGTTDPATPARQPKK